MAGSGLHCIAWLRKSFLKHEQDVTVISSDARGSDDPSFLVPICFIDCDLGETIDVTVHK